MTLNLTARFVAGVKPRAARAEYFDEAVPGLSLRVSPRGVKSWAVLYRTTDRRLRRLTIGQYPRTGLAAARKRANAELRKVDAGVDPQAERQAAQRAAERARQDSIDALCEGYIERHAKVKKRTWRDDQIKINGEILPAWKGRPVSSIERRDCRALVQAIADRGAPILANRTAALLSRLFRFAVDEEIISANPAAHLPKPGVEAQARPDGEREEKAYSDEEIRAIWTATKPLAPALRALYRLGLLTGQRPGEIAGMEWSELDGAWWTIPARRTKNGREHRVYLVQAALDELEPLIAAKAKAHQKAAGGALPQKSAEPLIETRKELAKVAGVSHDTIAKVKVFAGYRGKRQLAEVNAKVFAGVTRRLKPRHALRDTVATGLAAAGVAIEDIAKVLNHSYGPRVTGTYNSYGYDKEKRLAMGKWARRLAAILEATGDEKVIAFPAVQA